VTISLKARLPSVVTYSIFCIDVSIPVKCDSIAAAIDTACKLMSGGASVIHSFAKTGPPTLGRDVRLVAPPHDDTRDIPILVRQSGGLCPSQFARARITGLPPGWLDITR
jgi:hypothetical protein